MKKIHYYASVAIALSSLILFSFKTEPITEKFYYAYNNKRIIKENVNKIIVTFDSILNKNEFNPVIGAIAKYHKNSITGKSIIIETNSDSTSRALVEVLKNDPRVTKVSKMFIDDNNSEFGITNEILMKFKKEVSSKTKDSIIGVYKLKSISCNDAFEKYAISQKEDDVLLIANKLEESGLVIFSHPDFVVERVYCNYIPNDPYFNKQFYLHNTGQEINDGRRGTSGADIKAPGAWDISKGNSNITIAVLDMGVTANHPDLPTSRQVRLLGSNFYGTNPNDPSPNGILDYHGNASAGIIAATQDNNEGISGIAPNCKIMPINIGGIDLTYVNVSVLASAIELARTNGADIIYNGWCTSNGYPDAYPAIIEAIRNATTLGRKGKGCVVVVVPLNSSTIARNGIVSFPANVQIDGVLTVGASDRNDQKAIYSPMSGFADPGGYPRFGALIDLVAPSHKSFPDQIPSETSEIWTTDNPNSSGVNPYPTDIRFAKPPLAGEQLPNTGTNYLDYTGRFGGTSAAGPQVAGVAALILSVNPNLTQQQVFDILKNTSDKIGGYNYNLYPQDLGRSQEVGYGRLNACKALYSIVAPSFSIVGDDYFCATTSNTYSITNLPTNGVSVEWQATPTSIVIINSPNSTQTNITRTGDGIITLTAKISSSCSTFTISKIITVGTGNSIRFTQKSITCENAKPYFYGAVAEVPFAGNNYDWYSRDMSIASNPYILRQSGLGNTADFPLGNNKGNRYYTIRVVATTPCGTKQSVDEDGYLFAALCPSNGSNYKSAQFTGDNEHSNTNDTENPFTCFSDHSSLYINNKQNLTTNNIELFDMQGRKILSSHKTDNSSTILLTITELPSALYIVKIHCDGSIYTSKFIKQ